MLMRDFRNGLEIRNIILRVTNTLDVNCLGVLVDGCCQVLGLVSIHKLCLDTQTREEDLQLIVGSTVQVGCRDDVVPRVRECCKGHELRGLAGASRHSCNAAFQGRDTLLEDINGGLEMGISYVLTFEWIPLHLYIYRTRI